MGPSPRVPWLLLKARTSRPSTPPLSAHIERLKAAPSPSGPGYTVAQRSGPRHTAATAVLASSRYAKAGRPRRGTGHAQVSQVSTQLYMRLTFSSRVRLPTSHATRSARGRAMSQYGSARAAAVAQPW